MERRSFTAAYKLDVLNYADEFGTSKTSSEFGIDDRLIRKWKTQRNLLKSIKKERRAFRGKRPQWEKLEYQLKRWVISERTEKRQISTVRIRLHAKMLAMQLGINNFTGGAHWCHNFMRRQNLVIRTITSVGQKLPEDFQEKMARFQEFVRNEIIGVSRGNLGNMDEVPVSFDLPRHWTVDEKGKKDIAVTTTGFEKCGFTVVLAVTANGSKCPPLVIFKRKTVPKERFPIGIVVKANENGWMDESMMKQWIEECWIERPNPSSNPEKSLLILDSARAHLTETSRTAIKEHSKIAVIPGGLTKLLQPLDISVNSSFKNHLRDKWEQWMSDNNVHTYTKSGRMRRASYSEICQWILESFEAVSVDCIKNGFKRALDGEVEPLYEDFAELEQDE